MVSQSSVGGTTFDVATSSFLNVAQELLELEEQHLDESDGAIHLSDSDLGGTTSFVFLYELGGLHVSIAVLEFTIIDSDCMDHAVSIKQMVPVISRVMSSVGAVSEVDSADVGGSTIYRGLGDLGLDRSPISIQSEIRLIVL